MLRRNCAPSWLYLRDYTGMHGQQNIIFSVEGFFDELQHRSPRHRIVEIKRIIYCQQPRIQG
jgi:hypothetical protein